MPAVFERGCSFRAHHTYPKLPGANEVWKLNRKMIAKGQTASPEDPMEEVAALRVGLCMWLGRRRADSIMAGAAKAPRIGLIDWYRHAVAWLILPDDRYSNGESV